MKRVIITSLILILVLSIGMLTACTTTDESKYNEKLNENVDKTIPVLHDLIVELKKDGFSYDFNYTYVFYDNVNRGTPYQAGWQDGDWYVELSDGNLSYDAQLDGWKITLTRYEKMLKDDYVKHKDKKNYGGKFSVKATEEYSGVGLLTCPLYVDYLLDYENLQIQRDYITNAEDSSKIFNRVARVRTSVVYDMIGQAHTPDYCSKNFGEDLDYDWNNVSGMQNTTATFTYKKKQMNLKQVEIYKENVISYYVKNNVVDTSLVLKADVVSYEKVIFNQA